MKTKQLISALLALLLAFSLPAASAAEPPAQDTGLINVIVPSSGQIVINPYCLAVEADGRETREQLIHTPQALVNLSDFPVIVNAAVTGTRPAGSEAVFVPSPPFPDAPDKEVFLYAEFQNRPDWWTGSYSALPNQLVVSEWGGFQENVLTLDAQGEGWFRLFGELSTAPVEPWGEEDVFGAVLTFTFAPLYPELLPVEDLPPEDAETPPEETPPAETEVPEETETPEDPAVPEEPETPENPGPVDPADPPEETLPKETEPPDPPEEEPPEEPSPTDPPVEEAPEEAPASPAAPEPPEAAAPADGEGVQNDV